MRGRNHASIQTDGSLENIFTECSDLIPIVVNEDGNYITGPPVTGTISNTNCSEKVNLKESNKQKNDLSPIQTKERETKCIHWTTLNISFRKDKMIENNLSEHITKLVLGEAKNRAIENIMQLDYYNSDPD